MLGFISTAGQQGTSMNMSTGLRTPEYLAPQKVVLFCCILFKQDGLTALDVFLSFALPLWSTRSSKPSNRASEST